MLKPDNIIQDLVDRQCYHNLGGILLQGNLLKI